MGEIVGCGLIDDVDGAGVDASEDPGAASDPAAHPESMMALSPKMTVRFMIPPDPLPEW